MSLSISVHPHSPVIIFLSRKLCICTRRKAKNKLPSVLLRATTFVKNSSYTKAHHNSKWGQVLIKEPVWASAGVQQHFCISMDICYQYHLLCQYIASCNQTRNLICKVCCPSDINTPSSSCCCGAGAHETRSILWSQSDISQYFNTIYKNH